MFTKSEHETLVEKEAFHAAMTSWLEGLRDDLAREGVRLHQVQCRKGKAFLEIVACSLDLETDLIAIGARGAESLHLFHLGTTVEKVILKSAKPVMIVHPERPFRLGKILCPVIAQVLRRGRSPTQHGSQNIRIPLAYSALKHIINSA